MKYKKQIAYILSVILITGLLSGAILANAQDIPYTEELPFGEIVSTVSGGGLDTTTGAVMTVEPATGSTMTMEPVSGPTISVEPTTGSTITMEPITEPPVTDTPSPSPADTPKINVNVKDTFLSVKAGNTAKTTLSVESLTDEQGEKLENSEDFVYTWYTDKDEKVESKQTCKVTIKKSGLYKYYCKVTNAKTEEVIGRSEMVSVMGYTTNLSVTLPKNQKGGVSSAKITSDAIRNQLLGLKKKDAKSISISKISKKADKTNKSNLVVNKNKSVKVKTYLKGGEAKKALTIIVKNTVSGKKFTIKNITVESKLKKLPAGNVTMKLSQKNTLLTVTFKKVKGISYIRFGPTGKKPDKIVKKANKATYVAKYRNRAGFKSKEFQIALGYKTKYGIQYSSPVKKEIKNKKKK